MPDQELMHILTNLRNKLTRQAAAAEATEKHIELIELAATGQPQLPKTADKK